MSKRWHYTTAFHLMAIARDELLKPATAGLDPGERPAVWFSEQPFWEPTVQAMLGLAATINRNGFVVRFEVAPEVCPVSWDEFKRTSGVSRRTAWGLEKSGRILGADPELWWVTYDPVPFDRWLSIEVLDAPNGAWRELLDPSSSSPLSGPPSKS